MLPETSTRNSHYTFTQCGIPSVVRSPLRCSTRSPQVVIEEVVEGGAATPAVSEASTTSDGASADIVIEQVGSGQHQGEAGRTPNNAFKQQPKDCKPTLVPWGSSPAGPRAWRPHTAS